MINSSCDTFNSSRSRLYITRSGYIKSLLCNRYVICRESSVRRSHAGRLAKQKSEANKKSTTTALLWLEFAFPPKHCSPGPQRHTSFCERFLQETHKYIHARSPPRVRAWTNWLVICYIWFRKKNKTTNRYNVVHFNRDLKTEESLEITLSQWVRCICGRGKGNYPALWTQRILTSLRGLSGSSPGTVMGLVLLSLAVAADAGDMTTTVSKTTHGTELF